MTPGVGVGVRDRVGVGVSEGVGCAVTVGEGVGAIVATREHALATMSAIRSRITEVP